MPPTHFEAATPDKLWKRSPRLRPTNWELVTQLLPSLPAGRSVSGRQAGRFSGEPSFKRFSTIQAWWETSLIGALAHLGLGRAYALAGDSAKAKSAYQDFFALWKNADPDIPILKQAKAEYAKLN